MNIGKWHGQENLTVVTMDEFDVVLGLEFLDKVKAALVPYTNTMCILRGRRAQFRSSGRMYHPKCSWHCRYPREFDIMSRPLLLPLRWRKAQWKENVPKEIRGILEAYQDIMPAKLPSKLPPRREVDHKIELESGT